MQLTWHRGHHKLKNEIKTGLGLGEHRDHFLKLHEWSRPAVGKKQWDHRLTARILGSWLNMNKMDVQPVNGRFVISYGSENAWNAWLT